MAKSKLGLSDEEIWSSSLLKITWMLGKWAEETEKMVGASKVDEVAPAQQPIPISSFREIGLGGSI